jgi:hypothetical protein
MGEPTKGLIELGGLGLVQRALAQLVNGSVIMNLKRSISHV